MSIDMKDDMRSSCHLACNGCLQMRMQIAHLASESPLLTLLQSVFLFKEGLGRSTMSKVNKNLIHFEFINLTLRKKGSNELCYSDCTQNS